MKDLKTKIKTADLVVGTTIVDRQGYESVTFSFKTEDGVTVKVEEGDESNLSDAADVAAQFLIGDLVSEAADGSPVTLGYVGGKRYTRLSYVGLTSAVEASITSDNSFPVSDLDGLTLLITIPGYAQQTVTFPASTTTALQVAAAINAQCKGLSANVVSTDVVITTDAGGSDQTIALAGTATALTWEAVVVGTGNNLTDAPAQSILGDAHLSPTGQAS